MHRLALGLVAIIGAGVATTAVGQEILEVPRNKTLVSAGWDLFNQIPSPDNFNPFLPTQHQRNVLHYTINESLFYKDYVEGGIIPWLAESYAYGDDFRTVEIKLREGVTWADGEGFDAEDVAFTFQLLRDGPADLMYASVMKEWVESAEIVDPLLVRLTLAKPGPRFVDDFLVKGESSRFVVVPEHVWKDVNPSEFPFFDIKNGWPLGTGPYQLVRSDSTSMVFDRRDEWWAVSAGLVESLPAPERIVRTAVTPEALPNLYATNALDVGRAISVGAFEAARAQNPALRSWSEQGPVYGAPDGCVYAITFNNQREAVGNVLVRKAIGLAVDRDIAVDIAYEGSMPTAVVPGSSFPGVATFTEELTQLIAELGLDLPNPEILARLMGEAGYTLSDNAWLDSDGRPMKLNLLYFSGNPLGPVVTQQLRNAGFQVDEEVLQQAVFNSRRDAGEFDAVVSNHCGASTDPFGALQYFHSKYAAPAGESVALARAYSRYASPAMDAVLDRLEAMSPDPSNPEYRSLVREAYGLFLEDLPEIVIAEEVQVVVYNEAYWVGWPSEADPYTVPFLPWEGFLRVLTHLKSPQ